MPNGAKWVLEALWVESNKQYYFVYFFMKNGEINAK